MEELKKFQISEDLNIDNIEEIESIESINELGENDFLEAEDVESISALDEIADEIADAESSKKSDEIADAEFVSGDLDEKKLYVPKCVLSAGQIINIFRRMLREINSDYINLAEHTAFCAIKVYDYATLKGKMKLSINRNELILLSLLFTIGAYKKELKNLSEENLKSGVFNTFLYSYLFVKNMTPLKDAAEAILLFNYKYEDAKKLGCKYVESASLLFTCMRICIKLRKNYYAFDDSILTPEFIQNAKSLYNPAYIDFFIEANQNGEITNQIENNNYFYLLDDYCNSLIFDYDGTFSLLKMMVYAVDFVSTSTVTHIISASFLATEICKLMNLTDAETDEVFTAALIHDMGKLAVDIHVLESSGRLSEAQMAHMRTHVTQGIKICGSLINSKIADIAFRHHETIDGKGYPLKLSGAELTTQQKVMTLSDILSALTDSRAYKPSYPKEKTISILKEMADEKKLESAMVEKVVENYDKIFADTKARRSMLTVNLGFVMVEYMMLKDCASMPELFKAIREPIL